MSELRDITPDESSAPVYLDPAVIVPTGSDPIVDQVAVLQTSVTRLIALGLTEVEARAVARYDGPLSAG